MDNNLENAIKNNIEGKKPEEIAEEILINSINPVNLLDNINYTDFIKIQNDSFVNILRQNIPTLSIIALSIGMYILGIFSSCMQCSPFRTIILSIYVFILSTILTYQSVSHICPSNDNISPSIFASMLKKEIVSKLPNINGIPLNNQATTTQATTTQATTTQATTTQATTTQATTGQTTTQQTTEEVLDEENYNKEEVAKIIQAYENKNKVARLSTALGYAVGVTFIFTIIYILFPLLKFIPTSTFGLFKPILMVFNFLTKGPGSVIFPGVVGAIVFYFIQNYAQLMAAKRDCDRVPELQNKNFLIF